MPGIKIVLPETKSGTAKLGLGTRVYTSSGAEIEEIQSIEIKRFGVSDIITATLDIAVDRIDNIDNLTAELGPETLNKLNIMYAKNKT